MNIKKSITSVSIVVISALIIYGLIMVRQIFSDNTKFDATEVYVYIPTDSNYEAVKEIVAPYVDDMDRFDAVAHKKKYPNNVKPGKFLFKKGMNSNELINALRINNEVKLSFNNQERLEDFAGRIGSEIEADSVSLLAAFKDTTFLKENGFNEENVLTMFIPNTYELYWNTTATKFRDKMIKEYTSNYQMAGGKESFSSYYTSNYDNVIMNHSLKKNIVWANHNLVTDSVFAEVNLILCRNVLIYFDKNLQNKVQTLFYNSLINGGVLCLGSKESLRFSDIYDQYIELDTKQRIFKKKY